MLFDERDGIGKTRKVGELHGDEVYYPGLHVYHGSWHDGTPWDVNVSGDQLEAVARLLIDLIATIDAAGAIQIAQIRKTPSRTQARTQALIRYAASVPEDRKWEPEQDALVAVADYLIYCVVMTGNVDGSAKLLGRIVDTAGLHRRVSMAELKAMRDRLPGEVTT